MPSMSIQLRAIESTPSLYFWTSTFNQAQEEAAKVVLQDHAMLKENHFLITPERLQHAALAQKSDRENTERAWPEGVTPQPGIMSTEAPTIIQAHGRSLFNVDTGRDCHPDLPERGSWYWKVIKDYYDNKLFQGDRRSSPNQLCTVEVSAPPSMAVRTIEKQRQKEGWIDTGPGYTW